MSPTISAIINTFNRADIVVDAIESVLAQTYAVDELIVIDDGSTDNTDITVKSAFNNAPIPCRYIKRPNGGMASALNLGVEEIRSDLVAFLDDDDLWLSDHIESNRTLPGIYEKSS